MEGSAKVIEQLNILLASEETAIKQYKVHGGMDANWGYNKLVKYVGEHREDETRHSEMLIARILLLGGLPDADAINPTSIGADIPNQLANDLQAETDAIALYNAAIIVCMNAKDAVTRDMLDGIVKDETHHAQEIEQYVKQIQDMTLANWLSTQA